MKLPGTGACLCFTFSPGFPYACPPWPPPWPPCQVYTCFYTQSEIYKITGIWMFPYLKWNLQDCMVNTRPGEDSPAVGCGVWALPCGLAGRGGQNRQGDLREWDGRCRPATFQGCCDHEAEGILRMGRKIGVGDMKVGSSQAGSCG